MLIHRRNFLIGLASLLAAPAIVRAESIMPVRALILPEPDPLIKGIRWQSWPIGTPMPSEMCEGSIGHWSKGAALKPRSYWLARLEKHKAVWPVHILPDKE